MINPRKFALLTTKQKIYKIASTIRNCEITLKDNNSLDLKETFAYTTVLHSQEGKKIKQALDIINNIYQMNSHMDIKDQIKILNFAYHDLITILEQRADEDKNFSFIQFDSLDKPSIRYPWIGVLDNLRSPMNVGTIFRSADGFGTGELFLTGITPHPPNPKISRTALGAEEFVPYRYFHTTEEAIQVVKSLNYKIYALEIAEPSKTLNQITNFKECAFIFGNEEFGITNNILNLCDEIIRLPLIGKKNSLNVGNIFSIVSYTIAQSIN